MPGLRVVGALFAFALIASACGGGGGGGQSASTAPTTSSAANGAGNGVDNGGGADNGNGSTGQGSSSPPGEITLSIDGSIQDHSKSVYNATGGVIETSGSLNWSVSLKTTIDEINQGMAIPKIVSMSGSGWWKGYGAGGPTLSCSYNLSAQKNLAQSDLQALLSVDPPNTTNNPTPDFVVHATTPGKILVSDNTNPHESQCNTGPAGPGLNEPPAGTAQDTAFRKAVDPVAHFHPDGSSNDASNHYSNSGLVPNSPPDETVTDEVTVSTNITWGGCSAPVTSAAYRTLANHQIELVSTSSRLRADGTAGCLSIVWENDPNPDQQKKPGGNITGNNETAEVGQVIDLKVLLNGRDVTSPVSWNIPGEIGDSYDVTPQKAVFNPIPAGPISKPEITFFWVSAGASSGATFPADITVSMANATPATTHFKVTSPEFSFGPATECAAGLDRSIPHKRNVQGQTTTVKLPTFGLGENDDPKGSCAPGIKFDAQVLGNGELGVIQLINDHMWQNGKPCPLPNANTITATGVNKGYAADTHDFYEQGPTSRLPTVNDSPLFSLAGKLGMYRWQFLARDYLMYKPHVNGAFSYWVPLARLDWDWDATVTGGLGVWIRNTSKPSATIDSIPSTSWTQEPEWTGLRSGDNNFGAPC